MPQLTEEILAAQQAAYSVQGVDEAVPAAPVLAREAQQKRKLNPDEPKPTKKSKRPPKSTAPRQTAVYITSLPPSTTVQQLATAFLKAGLILEDAAGEPKVKLYYDQAGKFKGEALVVYLKEESVELAVRLLDDTELVVGSGEGEMKVVKATWENKAKPLDEEGREMKVEKGKKIDIVKQKNGRRAEKLKAFVHPLSLLLLHTNNPSNRKLADWSSDDEDAASLAAKAKYSRLVVLKGMFTLQELEEDATLLLDLKEDVREECESLGEVTNVTLYDVCSLFFLSSCWDWTDLFVVLQKEEDGIMTIRFKDELSAQACIIVRPSPPLLLLFLPFPARLTSLVEKQQPLLLRPLHKRLPLRRFDKIS